MTCNQAGAFATGLESDVGLEGKMTSWKLPQCGPTNANENEQTQKDKKSRNKTSTPKRERERTSEIHKRWKKTLEPAMHIKR